MSSGLPVQRLRACHLAGVARPGISPSLPDVRVPGHPRHGRPGRLAASPQPSSQPCIWPIWNYCDVSMSKAAACSRRVARVVALVTGHRDRLRVVRRHVAGEAGVDRRGRTESTGSRSPRAPDVPGRHRGASAATASIATRTITQRSAADGRRGAVIAGGLRRRRCVESCVPVSAHRLTRVAGRARVSLEGRVVEHVAPCSGVVLGLKRSAR